jgi:outer membrane receptor protein involved in Fe transport
VTTDPAGGAPICRAKLSGQDPSCIPWDIFAEGAASASAAAYLTVPSRLSGRVEERVANINITADLGQWGLRSPWADEAPELNVGGEYRKDQLSLDPDQHYRTADLGGLGSPILPLRGETSVKELFAEGRVPLVRNRLVEELTLEGGYRFSWHDNGTSRVSASSYKIGAEFSPIRGIRFRASQQRAVRAPNVQELFGETFATAFGIDPCAGPTPPATPQQCAASGVTGGQYGNIIIQPDPNQGYNAVTGGNANLKPERALTGTIGVVLQPQVLRGFTLSADWFDIRLARAIGFIGEQTILNTCIATGDPLFCARIHRDSEGSLWLSPQGYVDNTQANIGALKTSGVDVASSYRKRLGRFGSAGLQFQGTWTRRFVTDNGGLSKPYNCAGLYGVVCGFPLPRWRHNLRATWQSRRGPSLSILWRHMSAVPVDAKLTSTLYNSIVAEIPAQDYFDATATVRLGKAELRFGVRNVLDRQPPLVAGGDAGVCGNSGTCNGNTYPQLYDPLGRFVFAGATLAFGGR